MVYRDVSSQLKDGFNFVRPLHSIPTLFRSDLWPLLSGFHVRLAHDKPRQAMSVYTPVKHRPEWYWKEVFERRGIEAPGSSGYEDGWVGGLGYRFAVPANRPKDTWKVANLKLFSQMCFFFTSLRMYMVCIYTYTSYMILYVLW